MKSDKNFERFLEEIGQKVQIFRKGSLVTETIASIQSCKGFFKKEVDIKVGDEIIVEVSGERLIVEKVNPIYCGNDVHHIEVKIKKREDI